MMKSGHSSIIRGIFRSYDISLAVSLCEILDYKYLVNFHLTFLPFELPDIVLIRDRVEFSRNDNVANPSGTALFMRPDMIIP